MNSEIKGDFKMLDTFVKAISSKEYVKVGIMGSKNARKEEGMSNAQLGAIHEFGYAPRNIPPRSFLRMPIQRQSAQIIKEATPGMVGLLLQGKTTLVLKRLGIACENAIQLAFATRGFSQWAPNRLATVLRKKSGEPLIDTGQLRRSITSKVEKAAA